jgi:phosphoribosylformimino-5-aminoimidazole carboxamide ribotide isomerase
MMRIVPAIDLIEGRCVRLTRGDFSTAKVYNEDPLEVAKRFEAAGIKHLHLVDLDGAKSGKIVNYKILESISSNTQLKIDFGGGLKTDEDLKIAFDSGASQITAGSIAVASPEKTSEWLNKFGSEKIIIGADANRGMIAVDGWQKTSELSIKDFIGDYHNRGASHFISTDIARDGMMLGPSIQLYTDLQKAFPHIKLIASGGISSLNDLRKLAELGLDGAIVGKAIYEGAITLEELGELC